MNAKMFTLKARIRQQKTRFFIFHAVYLTESLVLSQSTPFQVISKYHGSQLRYYAAAHKRYKEPLVLLAVDMAIYDLYPYRSLEYSIFSCKVLMFIWLIGEPSHFRTDIAIFYFY